MSEELPRLGTQPITVTPTVGLGRALLQAPVAVALVTAAVALVTAVVAGVVSVALAFFNSAEQRKLEERKFEEGRIIELLRTGSIEKAKDNLEFLVRSGLVQDARLAASVEAYLKSKPKNQGPALPTYDTGTTYPDNGWGVTQLSEFEGTPIAIICESSTNHCTVERIQRPNRPAAGK